MNNEILQLLPFCKTDIQRRAIKVYAEENSLTKGSQKLGVHKRTLERHVEKVRSYAAVKGHSPEHNMTHQVPDPFIVKGVSSLYDGDGVLRAQWVKSTVDQERYVAILQEAVKSFSESIKREKPVTPPKETLDSLLNTYVITDYHLGMKAWGEETGDDWDLKIAEDLLVNWFSVAIKQSPDTSTGILAVLGDFLHWDGMDAVTPTSGHLLDADTRFQLVVRVAIRALRRIITLLLHKHKKIHIIIAEGNHDLASSIWLREWLSALYENEPRVKVDCSPDPYYCYEHGKTSVFFHHGHLSKFDSLDTVFAAKFREVFGRTEFSYAHLGHYHHARMKESTLMTVEQHRTLASKDAYASRGGYMAGRSASVITYHKNYGEIGRVSISPDMVK